MKFALIALLSLFSALPVASANEDVFAAFARWQVIHNGQCTQREVNRGCRSDWQCGPDRARCYRLLPGEGDVCVTEPGICTTACYCR